ncbi:lysophospholipase [Neolentinus lepideus HHB14362 ss-1]|uniref:Lysophospholipase n=1 Tax=Neolentinus lepideus HHB14362 ss-1 TaxID=1314782 RepID=A0A165V5Q6_9AGAM|nr:lysophospholipase [Neolentinus lepideus HHB14362 ss-1]
MPAAVLGQTAASKAYTPSVGACPEGFALHRSVGTSNQTLSSAESAYISSRKSEVLPGAWKSYLANVQATSNSLPSYVASILSGDNGTTAYPTLGIATSGGGHRAAIFGAGVLNALDGRNGTSAKAGTGGLLQSATYISGLSGGSWLLISLLQSDFPTIQELAFGYNSSSSDSSGWGGWLAQYNLIEPSGDPVVDGVYDTAMVTELEGKRDAGFPVTIADVWARLLSRHFVNGTNSDNIDDVLETHGAGITFSQIANTSTFQAYGEPFPIIVSDSMSTSQNNSNRISDEGDVVPLSNPLYEFNVYEFGSYDPVLATFIPTQYLGTTNTSVCITGFDQASFVEATSSELFNVINVTVQTLLNSSVGTFFELLNKTIPQPGVELDVALYPNPFNGVANGTYLDSNQDYLSLVDGGEDGETIPIQPLLVKARGLDVIFAIDAAADTNNYADGSGLIATQNRTMNFFPQAYSFPPVPTSMSTFNVDNLTQHPTFFGCDSSSPTPLLIYMPNGYTPAGQTPVTNTSTEQVQYSNAEVQAMFDQTFTMATLEGIDSQWPACLACAVVDRARARINAQRSGICESCFATYCYGGSSMKSYAASATVPSLSWMLLLLSPISGIWLALLT